MKYQIGEKVRIRHNAHTVFHDGELCEVTGHSKIMTYLKSLETGIESWTNETHLEPIKEVSTMRYKEGNVLVDRDGDKKTVLGVCGRVYLMSNTLNQDTSDSGWTQQELDNYGWKLFTGKDDEVEKAIKLLEEKGVVKNGIILKRSLK